MFFCHLVKLQIVIIFCCNRLGPPEAHKMLRKYGPHICLFNHSFCAEHWTWRAVNTDCTSWRGNFISYLVLGTNWVKLVGEIKFEVPKNLSGRSWSPLMLLVFPMNAPTLAGWKYHETKLSFCYREGSSFCRPIRCLGRTSFSSKDSQWSGVAGPWAPQWDVSSLTGVGLQHVRSSKYG